MSHCTDCYGASTIAPCASVGCLSINYGKCISYSGSNLFCATGAVGALTSAGTAVVPGTTTVVTLGGTNVTGTGTGATFEVTRTAGTNTYTVKIANKGTGYAVGNQVKILGTALGGATTANDLVITITELAPVIATGALLDDIITTFHNALCSGVGGGGGLDYSALSYSCLRQNGVLTGIGSAITTETQFVQSAAAALCSLSTSLSNYDTTVDIDLIEGSMPGVTAPYNLNEYLTGVTSFLNTLDTYIDTAAITANPCGGGGYAFTAKPSTSVLSDYFNWITTNVCGIYTTLNSALTTTTATATSLKTYIAGAGSVPANVNSSTLPGGSTTSTASAAINLLISQVASINSSIATIPSSNYAVAWNTAFSGTYPTNSVFKSQTWNYSSSSVSIQTHFDRIVNVLSRLNAKFDATYFTVDATSLYGPTISLVPGVFFSAASLNTVSINSLQDVNTAGAVDGDFMVYDTGSNEWVPKDLNVTINGSGASVTKTDTASTVTVNLTIPTSTPTEIPFVGYSAAEYTVVSCPRFSTGAQPFPYATKVGDIATIGGVFQIAPVAAFTWAHLGDKTLATVPASLQPTNPIHFFAQFYVKISGVYSVRQGSVSIIGGNLTANLMSPGGSLVLNSGDLIEISISGYSYNV